MSDINQVKTPGSIYWQRRYAKAADEIERLRAVYEAAKVYVRDSYRPEPKYDAKRFDALVDALQEQDHE